MIRRYFKEGTVLPKKLVEEKDLMSRKVAELREIAKERGVVISAGATKAEIVKALSNSDE
jgi:hypothetical protein